MNSKANGPLALQKGRLGSNPNGLISDNPDVNWALSPQCEEMKTPRMHQGF